MKKLKLTKLISSVLIAFSVVALNPIGASAEWRRNNDGTLSYYNSQGQLLKGWIKDVNGKYYYVNSNGIMEHDTIVDGYKLGSDGAWIRTNTVTTNKSAVSSSVSDITGWKSSDNTWYYYDSNNTKHKGWLKDNGYWYYFDIDGKMQHNTAIGGPNRNSAFDKSGRWINTPGWNYLWTITMTGQQEWCYLNSDLTTYKGWLKDNGYWYYLNYCFTGSNYVIDELRNNILGGTYMIQPILTSSSDKILREHHFDNKGRLVYTETLQTGDIKYYQ